MLGGGAQFASLAEFPVVTAALPAEIRRDRGTSQPSSTSRHHQRCPRRQGQHPLRFSGHQGQRRARRNMQFLATALKGVRVDYVNAAPGDLVPR